VFLADRGPGSRLTASVGVATLPEAGESAEDLLQASDAAMYRVKEKGKDGIHMSGLDDLFEIERRSGRE
jgi:diguanylate cyclase (GGDEF)-like protein